MHIPRYWSKATRDVTLPDGQTLRLSYCRSSAQSQADADALAEAAVARSAGRLVSGQSPDRYPYGVPGLREELVQEVVDAAGQVSAIVTRNAYGSLVLNAERLMFLDIDFPEAPSPAWYRRLFGADARASDPRRTDPQTAARRSLEEFTFSHAGFRIRLYRTFAGLRGLVTHALWDPADAATLALLDALGCDPMYVKLCRVQRCFRARLTPKPWRCGHYANRIKYPADDEDAAEYAAWKAEYHVRQERYATCRFLGEIGGGEPLAETETLVRLHDYFTRAGEERPLA